MDKMTAVRKRYREEVRFLVEGMDCPAALLLDKAHDFFGDHVPINLLMRTYCKHEAALATQYLCKACVMESVDGVWKLVENLTEAETELIEARDNKALYGRLVAKEEFSRQHGRDNDAMLAGAMLELMRERHPELIPEKVPLGELDAHAVTVA